MDKIYEIYKTINYIAFVIALLDKITCGSMAGLFWLGAKCFGGVGTAISCILFRHRTANGDVALVIFYAVIQLIILYVLGQFL